MVLHPSFRYDSPEFADLSDFASRLASFLEESQILDVQGATIRRDGTRQDFVVTFHAPRPDLAFGNGSIRVDTVLDGQPRTVIHVLNKTNGHHDPYYTLCLEPKASAGLPVTAVCIPDGSHIETALKWLGPPSGVFVSGPESFQLAQDLIKTLRARPGFNLKTVQMVRSRDLDEITAREVEAFETAYRREK